MTMVIRRQVRRNFKRESSKEDR